MKKIEENINTRNDFNFFIKKYLDSPTGVKVFQKYTQTSDVTPRNIYTKAINLKKRYLEEAFIIYSCFSYFAALGFTTENLCNDIPEVVQYFPWIRRIDLNVDRDTSKKHFVDVLISWIDKLFNLINPRQYGEYYTPLSLIELAYKDFQVNLDKKILDPSCGSGFFLYAYIEKLRKGGKLNSLADVRKLKSNLHGFDVFPFPVIISKLLNGYKIFTFFGKVPNIFKFKNIIIKNTLESLKCRTASSRRVNSTFDVIVGNPPFFRIDPNHENSICSCISYGHNYSHSLFLHWSIQHLNNTGKLCLILPQSILSGFYYQKLRKELLDRCSLDLIITNKDHEKSFSVQQDIMILLATIAHKKKSYYKVGVSSPDFQKIESIKVPIDITKNKTRVIPVFSSMKQYESLKKLSKHEIVDKLNLLVMSTGNFVWNQNKLSCHNDPVEGAVPLITGPNVTPNGIKLNINRKNNFVYCVPDKKKYIKTRKTILFRRMSPIGNSERMVASMIDGKKFQQYVVENHVNIVDAKDKALLSKTLQFITSKEFNTVINAFCHTNQVSTNELKILFNLLPRIKNNKKIYR